MKNMDVDLFHGGVRPKSAGTPNIWTAFASDKRDKLDAFILLSSAATGLGSKASAMPDVTLCGSALLTPSIPGQAHYNTANSFQEGFAIQKLAEQEGYGVKTHPTTNQLALITGSDADVTGAHRRKMFHRHGDVMVEFSEVLPLIEYAMEPQARRDGYV
jgi:hypothetical protein